MTTLEIMRAAKAASCAVMTADTETKNRALAAMARALTEDAAAILAANEADLAKARGTVSDVMLDRLQLTEARIQGMAQGILDVIDLPDPVGSVIESHTHPKGMTIEKVSVPLGVIAIIYEIRPNVTSDAAALAIKSGNACILRSGKEAHASAAAVTEALRGGLKAAGLPEDAVLLVEDTTRESANELMKGVGYIDLLDTRQRQALVPHRRSATWLLHPAS